MYVGIDIGGSKLLGVLVDPDGTVRDETRLDGDRSMTRDTLVRAIRTVHDGLVVRSGGTVLAVGVGFPGLVDHRSGSVRSSVILPEVGGFDLVGRLEETLGTPCVVDNDVNCAAIAEAHERRLVGSMLFVAVGTGIGGAVVLDGRLWRGARDLAGEIGHMTWRSDGPECICGALGCLHVYSSGLAVEHRLGRPVDSLHAIGARAIDDAWPIVEESAHVLGSVVASAVNLLDVPLVAIGGGLAELGPRYVAAVRRGYAESAMPDLAGRTAIESAVTGWRAGALGAAHLARSASPEP